MREIEFRIRSRDNSWYYGVLLTKIKNDTVGFQSFDGSYYDLFADATTLGQFTGLTDKNGTKIFEGDIVKCGNCVYVIDFGFHYSIPSDPYEYGRAYGFYFLNENEDAYYSIDDESDVDIEIIGNLYDNKELLEENK